VFKAFLCPDEVPQLLHVMFSFKSHLVLYTSAQNNNNNTLTTPKHTFSAFNLPLFPSPLFNQTPKIWGLSQVRSKRRPRPLCQHQFSRYTINKAQIPLHRQSDVTSRSAPYRSPLRCMQWRSLMNHLTLNPPLYAVAPPGESLCNLINPNLVGWEFEFGVNQKSMTNT